MITLELSCGDRFQVITSPGYAGDPELKTLYYPLDDNESFDLGNGMTCIVCDETAAIVSIEGQA